MNKDENTNKNNTVNTKPKKYVLDMFPYPSGEGLHVGHPKGYIATDIYSRMYKMKGYEVIHPMGWDAFGLPAEQFALKNKTHPKAQTEKNVANFKSQLNKINLDYDWDREISTTDPKFYKWTQWIFKQLYKKGLAYESFEPINWCPSCKTGLANEDLEGNACERCGTIVEKKPLRQWNLRITDYADRLINDLDTLAWPEWVKTAQKNWIGRSEGSEIDFKIIGDKEINFSEENNSGLVGYGTNVNMNVKYIYENKFTVFTTRADTLFGCTYTVLAPEHVLVKDLLEKNIITNSEEVKKYLELVKSKTDIERSSEGKEKTGVRLEGVMAINPANQKEVPVYIADYVLASYGTGAIMAVPAHDERDREFADKYKIDILDVVAKHFELSGDDKERSDVETLNRIVVDPIIRDKDDNFYLIKEPQDGAVHFAGGGVDEGETDIEAMKREILEELGFTDLEVLKNIKPNMSVWGYRHTKNKNQRTVGTTYEVLLDSLNRVSSEIEEGKHELVAVKKEDVLKTITWPHHRFLFEQYLNENKIFSEEGLLINSENFNGLTSEMARIKITEHVGGKVVTRYKLRDWVFARQRYWGEPFPIVFEEIKNEDGSIGHKSYVVADTELPILLPEVESYEPTGTGESPLANIKEFTDVWGYINDEGEFESVHGAHSEREMKTMDYYKNNSNLYFENTITKIEEVDDDFKKELDFIVDKFKSSRTLEIGSAFCRDIKYLKSKNLTNITASDISNVYEKYAKESSVDFIEMDLTLQNIESKYDLVLSLASLLHSEERNFIKIIRKINTSLNDSGYVYLRLQNGIGTEVKENKGAERFFTYYDEEKIKNILIKNSFVIERVTFSIENKWINVLAKKVKHLEPKLFKRETNTMPQWAGSSWYWLRFLDPNNDNFLIDSNIEKAWPQVDVYVGGDHATRHLIYARFWHKFLYDIGVVSNAEPFARLEFLGFILAEDGRKMSKRWGNIINPDDIVDEYGSDTLRLYEMFMAPFESTAVWNTASIKGVKRFVERVEKLKTKINSDTNVGCTNQNIIHQTIKKVSEDIENFKFNTCVSQFMITLNEFEEKGLSQKEYDDFMTILFPFAPTICLDYKDAPWPVYDENKLQASSVKIALQINGKLRDTFDMELNASDDEVMSVAEKSEAYKKYILEAKDEDGNTLKIKKTIVIKNKIVNIVV